MRGKVSKFFQLQKRKLELKKNFIQDFHHYYEYSAFKTYFKTQSSSDADLINFYHRVEKGLSFDSPKMRFGEDVIKRIMFALEKYLKEYSWSETAARAICSLESYYHFHLETGIKLEYLMDFIENIYFKYGKPNEKEYLAGVKEVSKFEIADAIKKSDFNIFTQTRYSVRSFSDEEVEVNSIIEAIEIAKKSPSVCNRQLSRVHIFKDKYGINKALSFQNGHKGFSNINKVVIITVNIEGLFVTQERNQAYIDGGIYVMNFLYALHSLGLGACALNLAVTAEGAKQIKQTLDIPENEVLICMVAIGHLKKNFKVALSERLDISNIYKIH